MFLVLSTASNLLEEINNSLPHSTSSECLQLLLTSKLKKLNLHWSSKLSFDEKSDATLLQLTNIKCSAVMKLLQLSYLALQKVEI